MLRLALRIAPLVCAAAPAHAIAAPPATSATVPAGRLSDENLLLFEVALDQLAVTDTLATYDAPDGPLIPLGALTRLLDADVSVSPAERRSTGTVGQARRPFVLDVASGTLRTGGVALPLASDDAVVGTTEIYVRPALLERLLPVKVLVDKAALRIVLHALEPLPIQSRLDRLARLRGLQPNLPNHDEVLRVAEPYRLAAPPSFDVTLASGLDTTRRRELATRYDVRAGADLLDAGFQAYLGSNDAGRPTTMRLAFERRDPGGALFGPLGATRAGVGDIFTPTLAIGPRSQGGRGVFLTTAPLEQASVFEHIDLRGELPIGYDVELYVNDILRGGQQKPVEGRYEFLGVPLVRGVNTIRLVSYGPHGERSEEVRVISVGGGQLEPGKLIVDFGAEQEGRQVVDLSRRNALFEPGAGRLRAVVDAAYGLSGGLTAVAGVASYAPTGRGQREMVTLGVRTALRGWAAEADGALDSRGGRGVTLGAAGSLLGVATVLRHSEYRGGYVDETIPEGGDGRTLVRYSQAVLDWAVKPFGLVPVPLTALLEREQFVSGDVDVRGTVRATSALGRMLLSGGLNLDRLSPAGAPSATRLTGNLAAATNIAFTWLVRGTVDFDLRRTNALRDATITADRAIGRTVALRLGVGRSFASDRSTTLNGSLSFRLPFGDLALDGSYIAPRDDWRAGLTLTFSLARNPLSGRYAARRIGAGTGGNLALQAFVDRDGDGVYGPGDQPVAGVALNGGGTRVVTDAKGRAFVTGLGYGPRARVAADLRDVDLPDIVSPPTELEFTPHPGGVAVAMYPLRAEGEVLVRVLLRQTDGSLVALSAVRVRAVSDAGARRDAATEYDGGAALSGLAPGRYRLVLDPDQAARLKMHLVDPVDIVVPPEGGVLPDVKAIVDLDRS